MSIEIIITGTGSLTGLEEALKRAPRVVMREIDRSTGRAANELVRKAKELAPKADSTLTNSLSARRVTLGEWIAGTSVRHGAAMEAGSQGRGDVPVQTLMAWIQRKRIVPRKASMTLEDLAFAIRRKIFWRGSRAQPFVQPALTALRPRIQQLLAEGGQRGLEQAFAP